MISVKNIQKTFKLYRSPSDRLVEIVFRGCRHRNFHVLNDVSFDVEEGETLGIIGQNGAGKSTLLKILTGILMPDSGVVRVSGKITGLLELGTGFNYEFNGMENIFLNGTLLGLRRDDIEAKLDEIVAFTELADFMEEPLKTYSSGMVMRLAFSIAIHADPKAFVVDEALSVGDAYFQQKCMRKIKQFKEDGGSIVFVSHDLGAVNVLCDKAMLLEHGRAVDVGDPERIINTYNFLLAKKSKGEEIKEIDACEDAGSYGTLKVGIDHVRLVNAHDDETELFVSGETCAIVVSMTAYGDVDDITVGIMIRDRFGQDIFGTNTWHLKTPIRLREGERTEVTFHIDEFNIGPGKYTITAAAHSGENHIDDCYQWVDRITSFEVALGADNMFAGLARLTPRVNVAAIDGE